MSTQPHYVTLNQPADIPFSIFVHKQIIDPEPVSKWHTPLAVFGLTFGTVSSYCVYPLGGSFGNMISDGLKITNPNTRKFIYHLVASNASMPIVALVALAAKDNFTGWVKKPPVDPEKLIKQDHQKLRRGLKRGAIVLACFGATTMAYSTYLVLPKDKLALQITMDTIAFLGGLLFKIAAQERLIDRGLDNFSKSDLPEIKIKRDALINQLEMTLTTLDQLSDEKFAESFNQFFAKTDGLTSDEVMKSRLKPLLLTTEDTKHNNQTIKTTPCIKSQSPGTKKLIQGLGFIIGATVGYTYYSLGSQAAILGCEIAKITDPETINIISNFVGSLAVIPWGAVNAEATMNRLASIYDNVFSRSKPTYSDYPHIRKAIPATSAAESLLSTIPLTYLAINAVAHLPVFEQAYILTCTTLGPFFLKMKSLENMLNQGVDWKEQQSTSCKIKRYKLSTSIHTLMTTLQKLPDAQVNYIYENTIDPILRLN